MANGWYNGEQIFVGQRSETELLMMTQEDMETIANAATMQFVGCHTKEAEASKSNSMIKYWKRRNEIQNQEGC